MKKSSITILLALGMLVGAPSFAQTFTTVDAPVAIPDNSGGVITACQTITVAGAPASITDVNVELGADHSWVGDTTVELTHDPGGTPTTLTLMNRPARTGTGAGDSSDLSSGFPVFYNDEIAVTSAEDMGAAAGNGDNVCEFDGICDFLPAPDAADTPNAGVGTNLADFNGLDANADWQLCMADSAGGDTGTLTTWSIGFGTLPVELQSFEIE